MNPVLLTSNKATEYFSRQIREKHSSPPTSFNRKNEQEISVFANVSPTGNENGGKTVSINSVIKKRKKKKGKQKKGKIKFRRRKNKVSDRQKRKKKIRKKKGQLKAKLIYFRKFMNVKDFSVFHNISHLS